jgi:uncharacterized membrane protein YfcA
MIASERPGDTVRAVTVMLATAGVVAGAALQSATGFGMSLVAAPLLFAAVGPAEAVGALLVVGTFVNVLTIATERRRPQPLWREVAVLLGWAMPGALAGVAVLRSLSPVALQLALTAGIVVTLLVRRRAARAAPRDRPARRWAAPVAGFAAGALTTATSTAGPPLVTHLLGGGHEPARVRDTLTTCFLGLGPVGALALLVTATSEAVPDPVLLAVLVPATAIGHRAGRPLFARLAHGGRYEPVLTVVLVISVCAGLLGALTS